MVGHITPAGIDRERLSTDYHYLVAQACRQLRLVDRYNRGMVTSANFEDVLYAMDLCYGQKEVEDLLKYITITDDGYVHYKELVHLVSPSTPRAKKTTAGNSIFPPDDSKLNGVKGKNRLRTAEGYIADRAPDVRLLYARWERSLLSGVQLKAELQKLGLRITADLERLISQRDHSKDMPFGKLMSAISVDDNDGRRCRYYMPGTPASDLSAVGGSYPPLSTMSLDHSQRLDDMNSDRGSVVGGNVISLRQAIVEFIDGKLSGVAFRITIKSHGIRVNAELDRTIRTHEIDNSVRFQDLAKFILSQDPSRSTTPRGGSRTQSESGGYPPSDGGGQGGQPYATNGGWETDAKPRDRRSSSLGPSAAVSGMAPPPWATGGDQQPQQQKMRSKSTSRAQGNHGNIVRWVEPQMVRSEPLVERRLREVDDCFNWDTSVQNGSRIKSEEDTRNEEKLFRGGYGKKLFASHQASSDQAPWGRVTDNAPHIRQKANLAVPFGTDKDCFGKPEDAGTDEYRTRGKSGPLGLGSASAGRV